MDKLSSIQCPNKATIGNILVKEAATADITMVTPAMKVHGYFKKNK